VAWKPSAVSGTSMRYLPFMWAASLPDFARTQSRKFLTSLTQHVHRGFVTPLPWRRGFIHLGAWFSGASQLAACYFHRSNGYWQDDNAVGCGIVWPTWLFGCCRMSDLVSYSSGAHRDVLLPSGGLDLWGSCAGYFHIPPTFIHARGPAFSGDWCRGIHPSIHSFNRSRGHYPGIRRTHLCVAELPAAVQCLFTRGGFHL
jgi:hypothetical protein